MTIAPTPRPVLIDTDPGVDDALALMLALRSPELHVELVTTVQGNVAVDTATANARRILALLEPAAWPLLAQGAARPLRRQPRATTAVFGADGLGGLTGLQHPDGSLQYPRPSRPPVRRQAVHHLLRLVHRYGADLTIIALGPLTNIARAVQHDPLVMQQLGRLIIMGGAIGVPGNVTPTAEFNIFVDPHAADVVLTSGMPITLVPLDVTTQVRLTHEFLQQTVHASENPLARAVGQMTRQMLQRPQTSGMAMHDPLAVAVAVDASLVRLTTMPVRVETRGLQTLGMTVADRRDASHWSSAQPRLQVALEVDAERMLALFAERVLAGQTRRMRQPQQRAGVVVAGSANTDLSIHTAHLPTPGETVLGDTLTTTFGGKGANQALAARRAGATVSFLGKLGHDRDGRNYAAYLQRQGIDLAGLSWDAARPSGVACITVDRHGQNQITVAAGANAALMPGDLHAFADCLATSRVFLTQLEIPFATVEAALRRAKRWHALTILNPAPARRLPVRFTRFVDILIPNSTEAAVLCGRPVRTVRQARFAARLLHQQGYRRVIITLGKRGVVYTDDKRIAHLPGHAVQARDTTAAGDTFVGYLACALAEGKQLRTAIALANAAAALTVTRAGAQPSIPYRHEAECFLTASAPGQGRNTP